MRKIVILFSLLAALPLQAASALIWAQLPCGGWNYMQNMTRLINYLTVR